MAPASILDKLFLVMSYLQAYRIEFSLVLVGNEKNYWLAFRLAAHSCFNLNSISGDRLGKHHCVAQYVMLDLG